MTWTQTTNLKFCLLNAENLFLMFEKKPSLGFETLSEGQWQKLSISIYENKPLKKCLELAQALKEIAADIIMLCEVGGLESLQNFNELFLQDQYSVYLLEGNSDRNIDVGFLVKKNVGFFLDVQSNKHRPINYLYPHERQSLDQGYAVKGGKITTSHKFSRDVAELRLFSQDKEKPFFAILLAHLKSRLDPERIDPNGFERRQAELRTLIEIYQELQAVHPNLPILVAGDFNGHAGLPQPDEEFKDIYSRTQLKDVLELAQVPADLRATYYQVRNGGRAEGRQIDYVFLSPTCSPLLKADSARVYRYRDEMGLERDRPRNLDAKLQFPSDHYPLIFELKDIPVF